VLIGGGVPTGFGSAVHAAATEAGDTIAIYGIGGIGINAVQGAALAGARNVVAIDPLANKREAAEQLGATHSCETAEQAQELITELTRGVGADKAIVTVGIVTSEVVANAFNAIRKGGTVGVTGLADPTKNTTDPRDAPAGQAGRDPPIVGLRREREVLTVALEGGRHVVIEGPPGTGKSTLLRDIARQAGQAVVFAEGNAELTPARLIGQYDPAQVLAEGYVPASFTDGPLLRAMRSGALLYLEEFNRVPEETLNVLITVLTEGEIAVPRLGAVRAAPGFRLVAAMNPFDAIGTARVSHAIADRICRIILD